MKKILTLLLSVGIFSGSFAQSNHQKYQYHRNDQYAIASNGRYDEDHDHDEDHDRKYDNHRNYSYENQQALEIQRVNQDYNYQVMSIQNNRFMKNHQKKVAIRDAQRERDAQIQRIESNYDRRNWRTR
jgi:hypothetical protein